MQLVISDTEPPIDVVPQANSQKVDSETIQWVCDLNQIQHSLQNWTKNNPNVSPTFSANTFSHPTFVQEIIPQVSNFTCNNKKDLEVSEYAGVRPEDIIFDNVTKTKANWRSAVKSGCILVIDSLADIKQLKSLTTDNLTVIIRLDICDVMYVEKLVNDRSGFNVIGIKISAQSCCIPISQNQIEHVSSMLENNGHKVQLIDISQLYECLDSSYMDTLVKMIGLVAPKSEVICDVTEKLMKDAFSVSVPVVRTGSSDDGLYCVIRDSVYGSFGRFLLETSTGYDEKPILLQPDNGCCEMRQYNVFGNPENEELEYENLIVEKAEFLSNLCVGDRILFPNMGLFTTNAALKSFEMNQLELPEMVFMGGTRSKNLEDDGKRVELNVVSAEEASSEKPIDESEEFMLGALLENLSLTQMDYALRHNMSLNDIFEDDSEHNPGNGLGVNVLNAFNFM